MIELIKKEVAEDGTVLMVATPFEPFYGDCDNCKHFSTSPMQHPSGKCTLHNFLCGYGFTCKDFSYSQYMIKKFQESRSQ